jgi:glycosyltransferase involved in cell wall biosynthesis
MPIVAANVGGVADLVQNGETGFLFKPNDQAGALVALERLGIDELMPEVLPDPTPHYDKGADDETTALVTAVDRLLKRSLINRCRAILPSRIRARVRSHH